MYEIGGSLAIAEIGSFLDQQLDDLRALVEECQVSQDAFCDSIQRLFCRSGGGIDGQLQVPHPMIDGRQKKLLLAREVTVNRPLADPRFVGNLLDIRRCEPVLREHGRGGVEDFRTTTFLKLSVRGTPHQTVTF